MTPECADFLEYLDQVRSKPMGQRTIPEYKAEDLEWTKLDPPDGACVAEGRGRMRDFDKGTDGGPCSQLRDGHTDTGFWMQGKTERVQFVGYDFDHDPETRRFAATYVSRDGRFRIILS